MVEVTRIPVSTDVCLDSFVDTHPCIIKTYDISEVIDREPIEVYTHEFFTDLPPQRLARLSQILEIESGEDVPMFGFKEAIYYTYSKVWHFVTIHNQRIIIVDKQLKSIGIWLDSQSELEDDLIYQSQQVIDRFLERERQLQLEETTEFVEFDDYMVAINDSGISLVGLDNRYVA